MASITMDSKNLRTDKEGKVLITYDQIVKMPEFPESPILELFNGKLFVVPSPSIKHRRISGKLENLLRNHVNEFQLGEVFDAPTDVKLSDENLVVPDIFFISINKQSLVEENFINGPPNMIIEILSSNKSHDLNYKKKIYEKFGVLEYWIVDPENKSISVFSLQDDKFVETIYNDQKVIRSQVVRDFILMLTDIF